MNQFILSCVLHDIDYIEKHKIFSFSSREELENARYKMESCGYNCETDISEYIEPYVSYLVSVAIYPKVDVVIKKIYSEVKHTECIQNFDIKNKIILYWNINSLFLKEEDAIKHKEKLLSILSEFKLVKTSGPTSATRITLVHQSLEQFTIEGDTFDMDGKLISTTFKYKKPNLENGLFEYFDCSGILNK